MATLADTGPAGPLVTKHGRRRVRQRLGIPAAAVTARVALAWSAGRPASAFAGAFAGYLGSLTRDLPRDYVRVHGGAVFLFDRAVYGPDPDRPALVTCWPVPACYRRCAA